MSATSAIRGAWAMAIALAVSLAFRAAARRAMGIAGSAPAPIGLRRGLGLAAALLLQALACAWLAPQATDPWRWSALLLGVLAGFFAVRAIMRAWFDEEIELLARIKAWLRTRGIKII